MKLLTPYDLLCRLARILGFGKESSESAPEKPLADFTDEAPVEGPVEGPVEVPAGGSGVPGEDALRLLGQIEEIASQTHVRAEEALAEIRAQWVSRYPDETEPAAQAEERGRQLRALYDQAAKVIREGDAFSPQLEEIRREAASKGLRLDLLENRIRENQETKLLWEIVKYARWGKDGQARLKVLVAEFRKAFPDSQEKVEKALNLGVKQSQLQSEAYSIAGKKGKGAPELKKLRNQAWKLRLAQSELEKHIKKGHARFVRFKEEQEAKAKGGPISTLQPPGNFPPKTQFPTQPSRPTEATASQTQALHSNDLRTLAPARHWQILMDETGRHFGSDAQLRGPGVGRFVALALPRDGEDILPKLPPQWHAVEESNADIDRVLQSVLDAPVGVLGFPVTSLPVTQGERWVDGIALTIDWVLRLLPLEEESNVLTRVEVLVERRGDHTEGQPWELVVRESLRRLALVFPKRAALLDLSVELIRKEQSPWNGYVDAIAYTWAQTSDSSRERLRLSGWSSTCLLELDPREMLHGWDAFAQGVHLAPPLWWKWLASPEAMHPASILHTFLQRVGNECRARRDAWKVFLDYTRMQMAASPVDLRKLGAATRWLQEFQPEGSSVPPLLRLSFLTVQLAQSNHMGASESAWAAELRELASRLLEEAAPMVCHADLHLAVAHTNRFEFSQARACLAKWESLPVAVPGLQRRGQILSSLGQHAAFSGDHAAALPLLEEALSVFARLSDGEERAQQTRQTACYRAIVMMDSPGRSAEEIRTALEQVLGPIPEAIERLASSADPANRYEHHLLLRWLVGSGDAACREAYVALRPAWQTGVGHPWPLIGLYRGMLLQGSDPDAARDLAMEAAASAFSLEQGPVVRLIGACCRVVAMAWGAPGWKEGIEEIARLREALPAAEVPLRRLEEWLQRPSASLETLQGVLPFNFH